MANHSGENFLDVSKEKIIDLSISILNKTVEEPLEQFNNAFHPEVEETQRHVEARVLPLHRIKKIIKMDDDVRLVNPECVDLMALICVFI
ncbi:hypothetical protein MXB_5174 [Myxobolus squamalis]|nr:hypothetical protein MXB_5174 [Myxobolus squamalis]